MPEPTDVLQGLRASTADLVLGLTETRWTDAELTTATLLPGWTRGHLLTHLARNADSIAGTLSGTLRGEVIAQYPGGRQQRNGDIEAGAGRHLAEQLTDVRESAAKLDRVFGALGEAEAWDRPSGDDLPAHEWLRRRWLEVEVHRVDLDCGYTPDRWPPLFVASLWPEIAPTLGERATGPVRVEVTVDGSLSGAVTDEVVGSSFEAGHGDARTEVRGPDWAVLAWLLGRRSAAEAALGAAPALRPWR